ncbi:hypothetical protein FE257_011891 [Aspergillus nanangensis]|uniref:Short chain dehydrogenase/reductase n=1 Tax=Aspergillus nanangensis TaxID=2582783 RepID=A0AAD4CIB5_ASPNN|nr:hypothetical protein FE257_011891 [Aspergillus nanangensis]
MGFKRSGASGIGLGITRYFITQPDTHITILDVNPMTATETLNSLRSEFSSSAVSFEQCDVSCWESQAVAFKKIYSQQGRIDIVFANAGITEKGTLLPPGDSNQEPKKPDLSTLNVNLLGAIYSVQLAIYYISKNMTAISQSDGSDLSSGLIVCNASIAALCAFPISPIYAASKSGLVGLVRSLARPLSALQIRINAIAPSVIETNIAPSEDLYRSMILTPMSTAINAVAEFVSDESLTGKIAELHAEKFTFVEPPAYVDEDTRKNIEMFWSLGYA